MSKPASGTDRRSFLKSGAIAAAPFAAVVPGAAIAMDDSAARLARLEDERAVEALHRRTLRSLDTRALDKGIVALTTDAAAEPQVAVASDRCTATVRHACRAEIEVAAAGESTVEQMTRFQGHGAGLASEKRTLVAEYTRTKDGWDVTKLHLA